MKTTYNRAEEEAFILQYLRDHPPCVSVLDNTFCEAFSGKFGGTTKGFLWGANPPVRLAARLKRLYSSGSLERNRTGLRGSWQPGFPKWVWTYTLPKWMQ